MRYKGKNVRIKMHGSAAAVFVLAMNAVAVSVHVAPDGDDENPGTEAAPFATLERARLAVRAVNTGMTGDVIVHLAPGDYPVTAPVVFGPRDSGFNGHEVIYRADGPPGSARLVGGQAVANWQPWQGEVVVADLGLPAFHTLYENGRRARKARFPNLAPDPALPLARGDYLRATGVAGSHRRLQYAAGALDPAGWDLSGAQVHLWPGGKWAWFTDTVPIASIDPAARVITLAEDTRYDIHQSGVGSRFFVQGVLDLLDEPGEFHYDTAAGRLYYWPMDGPAAEQEIIVPRVRRVLSLAGGSAAERVHDLRFEGLGIAFTDFTGWYRHAHVSAGDSGEPRLYPEYDRQATLPQHREGAVVLENTEAITFDSCDVRNTGYSGFFSYGANRNNTFLRCRIAHVGMHGFMFEGLYPGEGDVQTLNTVDNCLIHDIGELAGQGAGVQLTNAGHHEIAHCVIDDSPRYAVSLNAYVNIPLADIYVHDNHIHHLRITNCCQDSGDTAPIYAFGLSDDPPYHVNRFEQLLIDDTHAHPSMIDAAPNGVFLDNDSQAQELIDIEVRNSQGAAFRLNDSGGHTLANVSWQAGFDPARMDYDTIGVRADFPFAVAPIRLAGQRVAEGVALSWLPVANATAYTVWAADSATGPWQELAAGLTAPAHTDPTPATALRYYRVTATGPLGTGSEPSKAAAVGPPPPPPPAGTLVYDFDNGHITGSPYPGTSLIGQDGWVARVGDMKARNDLTRAGGAIGGISGYLASGDAIATRLNDAAFQYAITGPTIRLSLVARLNTTSSAWFGLGVDADDNGTIGATSPEDSEVGFQFGFTGGQLVVRRAAFGSLVTVAAPMNNTEIWRVVLDVDLSANGGDGSGSLSAQYLGDDDGSFDAGKSTTLDPVAGLQDINLGILAMAEPDYTRWDGIYARIQNGAAIDTLSFSGDVVAAPGDDAPRLAVTWDPAADDLTFTWDSRPGKLYDLLGSTNLDTPPSTPWAVYDGRENIPADPSGTNTLVVPRPPDVARFFAIRENDPPEP